MYPYIDMHCDTLLRTYSGGSSELYDGDGMLSLKRMKEAGQLCQFFAIFFPPKEECTEADESYFVTLSKNLRTELSKHSDIIGMAFNRKDIEDNKAAGRMSAVLTVEDGRMVSGSLDRLRWMYDRGVRAMTLTWNSANCMGYPHSENRDIMSRGLTEFGKAAIELMNELGMLIDVSHLSDGGFMDVARISSKPFAATHSCCRSLNGHTRNLTDDMLRLLAQKGGVAGVNFSPTFTPLEGEPAKTTVDNISEHVLHMINVGGEDCVGLGTDFDGISGSIELDDPRLMYRLFDCLQKKGLSDEQLEKLAYKNVLRVIGESMK